MGRFLQRQQRFGFPWGATVLPSPYSSLRSALAAAPKDTVPVSSVLSGTAGNSGFGTC